MMRYFIGIDPGANGAIAIIDRNHPNKVSTIPMKKHTEAEVGLLLAQVAVDVEYACLEDVHAFPGQGVSTTFKFGASFGFCRGLLAAFQIPYMLVSPMKWQRTLGCMTKGDKNVTKLLAMELFPDAKVSHSTADAILIAHYCYRVYGGLNYEPYGRAGRTDIDNL